MSQLNKKKPEQMFGWLSKLKDKTLRVLFPNEWGGTNYHAYKWNLHQFYITPAIQWIKGCKVFLKFWKIPFAIQDLEQVGEDAIFVSSQAIEKIDTLNSTIDALIEGIVERRYDQTPIAAGMSEDDHYKKCYREVFKECCREYSEYEKNHLAYATIGDIKLDSKYLTEDEYEDRFDMDYEEWRCGLDPYNTSHHNEACYLMNDLKNRGFYDN
jgi:hypothetical protein